MKPLALVFCGLLSAFIVLGSTMAWFTAGDTQVNPIKAPTKGFLVELVDIYTKPGQIRVGEPIPKVVGAANRDTKPGFVRILVLPVFVTPEGALLPAQFGVHLDADWNAADWKPGGDGYYYYLHRLEAGESTDAMAPRQNLFTQLEVLPGLPAEYEAASLRVEVKLEAVGIEKWEYRLGWWGSAAAPAGSQLAAIDAALSVLAT
jgi:hypothetical protein